MKSEVFQTNVKELKNDLLKILKALEIQEVLKNEKRIIFKPNLTTNIPYPVTTDPAFVQTLIELVSDFFKGEILIAEGSGGCDTKRAFEELGYEKIEKKFNVKLIDLNREERIEFENPKALKLKKVWLPKILFTSYLISLPIPKDHGEATFTCALKNQVGIYLSKDFVREYNEKELQERGVFVPKEIWNKGWNKGELHFLGLHETIFDLNLYRKPDLVICDARTGIRGGELGGKEFKIGKIIASFDPVALDVHLTKIFDFDWKKIRYLVYSNKILGEAESYEVLNL